MAILSDFYKPPVPPIEPCPPKIDPCLLEFLRKLNSRITDLVQSVDPNLLSCNWPDGSNCDLAACVELAVSSGYAKRTKTGVCITQKGRDLIASQSAA